MESRDYCPCCGTFNIRRIHRGFIKKKILMSQPAYACNKCGQKFSLTKMANNSLRKKPELLY